MKFKTSINAALRVSERGFSFVEVMVSVGIFGVSLVSLFGGFTLGFAVLRATRENMRATQILEERMEVIRLIKWDNVAPGFIPTAFNAPFNASDPTNAALAGFVYHGTVLVTNAPLTESYATNLRMVRIELTWTNANEAHKRQMTTFVSKYGMQNYIY